MQNKQNERFSDCLDTVWVIEKPAKESLGEDSFYCAAKGNSALVCVCDGCGGLGARKYETFEGHTGAYIASRAVSGGIHDWYHHNYRKSWKNPRELSVTLDDYIRCVYAVCEPYAVEKMRIAGSMVRRFPTTLALAYAESDKEGILIHLLWAGDSRVYLLDENGLAQLTKDDTDVEDALENLFSDGALTNVLSSDGKYQINYKTILLDKPALIFAATDGCFGYISSPMEFEYTLLRELSESKGPAEFKNRLRNVLAEYAGDDLAMGLMSFYYGSFDNTKNRLKKRLKELEAHYISPIHKEWSDELVRMLWNEYKKGYERYLR